MDDYSMDLLMLKEHTRRYSDRMRDRDYSDARYEAMQIAKCAMACLGHAKEMDEATRPVFSETED